MAAHAGLVVPTGAIAEKTLAVDRPAPTTTEASSEAPSLLSAQTSIQSTAGTPASSMNTTSAPQEEKEEDWKPPTDGPQKIPIPRPAASFKPQPPPKLTPEQEAKYNTVLASVSTWTKIPATLARNAPQTDLSDHERMWLTRECLLRYLRATKWKPADALKRLQHTLSWRREYGADAFTADYISVENETGKQVQLGFDCNGRPCLYLTPSKQNTKVSDRQVHHLCYMLDRTIDMMPPGVENNALIVNFKSAGTGNVPSLKQAQAVLNILQTHNPERLGRALIMDTPWYVNTFFKVLSPFIDPVTKDKMRFNEDLRKLVPPQQLWDEQGGDLKFEYDHATYWPAFTDECAKKREAYRARWEKAGKQIGEYEEYLRGGNHPPLTEMLEAQKAAEGKPQVDAHAEASTAAARTAANLAVQQATEGVAKLDV